MKLSIEEIEFLFDLYGHRPCDENGYAYMNNNRLFGKLKEELKNEYKQKSAFATGNYSYSHKPECSEGDKETLDDLISSIEGIESVVYISNFDDITIIANKNLLSNEETHRLFIYASNNKNIIISLK